MATSGFQGFPKEGMSFLRTLEKNNARDWFQPRKEIYETKVQAPMRELLEALNADLAKFAPEYFADPKKAIYRIHRDTRFSNDKTPYKTHIAANVPRRGMDKHAAAGFYLSVAPKGVDVAGGVYMPGPEELLTLRMHLALNHARFRKLAGTKKLVSLMGELQGEALVRVPKGFAPGTPAEDLIKRKQWYFYRTLDAKLAAGPGLRKELKDRFQAMLPVLEFLNEPLLKRAAKPKDPLAGE